LFARAEINAQLGICFDEEFWYKNKPYIEKKKKTKAREKYNFQQIKIEREVLKKGIECVASAGVHCDKDENEKRRNGHERQKFFEKIIA
jgi:hypothetical protein